MSNDNSEIDPYFSVDLDGENEKNKSEDNAHVWKEVKSKLRNSFSSTNKIDLAALAQLSEGDSMAPEVELAPMEGEIYIIF